ncbi:hypothetical protein J6590_055572 [Homalodisca vitripennis]|nr:hypothetical protein J6590_055572 [Homalodisca vitripennis]
MSVNISSSRVQRPLLSRRNIHVVVFLMSTCCMCNQVFSVLAQNLELWTKTSINVAIGSCHVLYLGFPQLRHSECGAASWWGSLIV